MEGNLSCFHGSICRDDAEQILTRVNTTGAFLLRNSETMAGCYTLCLWADDGFHQYRIINDGDGVYIKAEIGVEETKYPNLLTLVEFYRSRDTANGLAAPLKLPIGPETEENNGLYDLKKGSNHSSDNRIDRFSDFPLSNKMAEMKQLLVCYFQHKFKYERHNRFNTIFYNMMENYLDSGEFIEDLEHLERGLDNSQHMHYTIHGNNLSSKSINKELNIQYIIDHVLERVLEAANDSVEKLLFIIDFFSCFKESDLESFTTFNYEGFSKLEQLQEISLITHRLEVKLLNNLTETIKNLVQQSHLNSAFLLSSLNGNKPISSYLDETMTSGGLKAISHVKIFEVEVNNSKSNIFQAKCKVSIDLFSCKMGLELFNARKGTVYKQVSVNCEDVNNLKKCESNKSQLQLSLCHQSCQLMVLTFSEESQREEFISYVYGAKRLKHIDKVSATATTTNASQLSGEPLGGRAQTVGVGNVSGRRTNNDSTPGNDECNEGALSVFVGTWNVGTTQTIEKFSNWFKCQGVGQPMSPGLGKFVPHDIYVVGLQEVHDKCNWDSLFASSLSSLFNRSFSMIATKSNSFPKTLNISVFCRTDIRDRISDVFTDSINTGFAKKMGNKGAVSVSFLLDESVSFCFIDCHLSSGGEHVKRREEEFRTILSKLQTTGPPSNPACSPDLFSSHDFIFCTGDFNLRTDLPAQDAIRLIQSGCCNTLLNSDELYRSRTSHTGSSSSNTSFASASTNSSSGIKASATNLDFNPFHCFKEPKISHHPTYRYMRGSKYSLDPYKRKMVQADRINTPSWCDRVFYRSQIAKTESVIPLAYGINLDYKCSDHKPVFSSFLLSLPTQDFRKSNNTKFPVFLQLNEVLIKLNKLVRSKNNFAIQISGSTLMNGTYVSQAPQLSLSPNSCEIQDLNSSKMLSCPSIKKSQLVQVIDLMDVDTCNSPNTVILFVEPFQSLLADQPDSTAIPLKPGLSRSDINTNSLLLTLYYTEMRMEPLGYCRIPLHYFNCNKTCSFEIDLAENGIIIGSMMIRGCLNITCTDLLNLSENRHNSRVSDYFNSTYYSDEDNSTSKGILELFNNLDKPNFHSSTLSSSNHDEIPSSNPSAFKEIDSRLSNQICSCPPNSTISCNICTKDVNNNNSSNINNEWRSLVRNVANENTKASMNGFVTSSSMRVGKNRETFDYKERQNLSDDSESINTSGPHGHTSLHSVKQNLAISSLTKLNNTATNCHTISNHHGNRSHGIPQPSQYRQPSHDKNDEDCDEAAMLMVNNENYATTEAIRGGVTNHRRNQDARVDLSNLEEPPLLPPRNTTSNATVTRQQRGVPLKATMNHNNGNSFDGNNTISNPTNCSDKNNAATPPPPALPAPPLRPVRTRQHHGGTRSDSQSNTISITSSSSAATNSNISNMNGGCIGGGGHNSSGTQGPPGGISSGFSSIVLGADVNSSSSSNVAHRKQRRHCSSSTSSSCCEPATNTNSMSSSFMTNHDDLETPYNHGTIIPPPKSPINTSPVDHVGRHGGTHLNSDDVLEDDIPDNKKSNTIINTHTQNSNNNNLIGHYVQAVHTQSASNEKSEKTNQKENQTKQREKQRFIQPYASMKINQIEDPSQSNIDENNENIDIEYVVLQKPNSTIKPSDWLKSIQLPLAQLQQLQSLSFFNPQSSLKSDKLIELTDGDLQHIGVNSSEIRHKMLQSLRLLRSQQNSDAVVNSAGQ